MTTKASLTCLVLMMPALAGADEVLLRGGGKITGVVVERNADSIVLETGPGRVTVPLSRVESIREGRSDLATYQQRASALQANDLAGWVALARWAAEHDLGTQSREAYHRVVAIDPSYAEANRALGQVEHEGRWMPEAEANRAKGLIPFEGRWVTPAEFEAVHSERAAESAEAREVREAQARAREAEARAREAEARAAAAEHENQGGDGYDDGVPLWPYVYGPGGVVRPPHHNPRPPHPGPRPPVTQAPAPPHPPSSVGSPPKPAQQPPTTGARVADPSGKN